MMGQLVSRRSPHCVYAWYIADWEIELDCLTPNYKMR